MLSALVGDGVSRGQQLPMPEAASLLLAQELCIGLRTRRVTRMSAQTVPRSRQLPASPLLLPELQGRRATRASSQGRPHREPGQHVRTHTLKSSGRTVRKLNYREVTSRGLLQSAAAKRNTKPRGRDPAAEGGEGQLEARVQHKEQPGALQAQEVGLVQRRRAGAVGKMQPVTRRSKARSNLKPDCDQASSEADPGTWTSSAPDIKLKVELPEVRIPSDEEVDALAVSTCGGDGLSCGAAPSVVGNERTGRLALMDRCEGRIPADVPPPVTKSHYPQCQTADQPPSGDGLGRTPTNQMCTENAAPPENTCAKGPNHPARPVKIAKVGKLDRGEVFGEASRENAGPVHTVSCRTFSEAVLVQRMPVGGVLSSDGSDQIHASVSVEGLVTIGMIAESRLGEAPSDNAAVLLPLGGEVTTNVLVFQALDGGMTSEQVTCLNLRADHHPGVPTAASELITAKVMATNGPTQDLLPGTPLGNSEMVETEAEREMTVAMPVEEDLTSGQLAGIQRATQDLAQEEAATGFLTFEFPAEHKVTDAPADPTSNPQTTADPGNTAHPWVTAANSSLPENEVPPETAAEASARPGLPEGFSVERAMASIMLRMNELVDVPTDVTSIDNEDSGEDELTTDDELTSGDELTTEDELTSDDELSTDGRMVDETLMEAELADIPADTTAAAMEVCTAVELAREMGVAPSSLLTEEQLANEPLEEVETTESVTYEVLVDGELVDIPTDIVIIELTGENQDEGISFDFGLTKETIAENGLVVISSDTTGPARVVFSQDRLSQNELVTFSQESLASLKDEEARDPATEGGLAESGLMKPDLEVAAGDEAATVLINAGAELGVALAGDTLGGDMKASQTTDETSALNSLQNKRCEPLMPKGVDVWATADSEVNECQNTELGNSESGCMPLPLGRDLCPEQEVRCVEKESSQLIMDGTTTFGKFGTAPVCKESALFSVKWKALINTNRTPELVRLKTKESSRAALLSNCAQYFSHVETFREDRLSECVGCRSNKCDSVSMGHKLQLIEGVKPKNLPLLLMHDLGHGKRCGKLAVLEHLSDIANGLSLSSECAEMQQEFSQVSDVIVALGMCSRFQFQKGIDLQFCFSSEQAFPLDPLCYQASPNSEQCASGEPLAQSHHKDPDWPFPLSMHFHNPDFPISPPASLAPLPSWFARGAESGDHGRERTALLITPQHSRTASQCRPGSGSTFCTLAVPLPAGRCPCSHSRFGLHTVLALSSPACYRLWTRQRHFGRTPNAHWPFLTPFGGSLEKLIVPVHPGKPFWSLSYTLGRVVSWWSQHSPTSCASRFSTRPSSNCGRSVPSFHPSNLFAGNGTNLSEAKSLLILQTNNQIDLQSLNIDCINEPYLALPDPPTSTPGCTMTDGTFTSSAPLVPSITCVETQLRSEQKEEHVPYDKSVSKSKGSLRKVSQIRIRKSVPKQDTNLTPMGLPKPKRLKKKEFSLEEIYTNQNYKSPSAHSKYLETIFEEPVLKKGSFICTSLQKRKRLLEFQDYTLPRKRRAHARVKFLSRTRGRKATTRDGEIDSLLVQKLTELEAFLAEED
ncbi:uncharacterized protein wu:fi75a02 isoform X2 [Stegostoma tigrinum]|nr:uncharacterized protein wu:fi75a02 isoform X2 [Stegostoma tigrinum]XP_048412093.1 uncharacterized protein wu:fi75a02 isoform X2 [Stegostoma tigrinum]